MMANSPAARRPSPLSDPTPEVTLGPTLSTSAEVRPVPSLTGPATIQAHEEDVDDHHHGGHGTDTPLRPDAFDLPEADKIERIAGHFRAIMETLGLDLTDDSLASTPLRVAKMYVREAFSGLDPERRPTVTLFDNRYGYDQMLVEKDITLYSHCEHHFVPIIGKAHVAYYSTGKVVGLSKINRMVQYYARRPQVQERLTQQIGRALSEALSTPDVAVMIDAAHMCVASRGIQDTSSQTITTYYSGRFEREAETRAEFISLVGL